MVSAIHKSVGLEVSRASRKRVRPGVGKCQGGFCEPKVVEILAKERIKPLTCRYRSRWTVFKDFREGESLKDETLSGSSSRWWLEGGPGTAAAEA